MRLRDHWTATAPLWSHGRPMLTWHVLPTGRLDLLANWLAPMIDRPFLTPVPPEWLHLTTQGVGLDGDVPDETLSEIVAEAQRRCAALPAIDALVGPARVVDEGVTADVAPVEELAALRDALQDADAAVRGREAVPDWRAPFWPHVTFAYATEDAETEPIEAVASDALTIDAVTLLRLHREPRLYRWDVLATVPLGAAE